MAKSKSGEFYTFDEVLKQLQIDESRLKRLVSEGEIRAFREGDQMRFKRSEIDTLAGRTGTGGASSDTSLTEISLEDESQPTVSVGGAPETLADELIAEPEAIPAADVSSQDTYIDQSDVGMSTEPIDFTEEDESLEDAEEIEDMGVDRPGRRRAPAGRRAPATATIAIEEPKVNVLFVLALTVGVILSVYALFVTLAVSRGYSDDLTSGVSELMVPESKPAELPGSN